MCMMHARKVQRDGQEAAAVGVWFRASLRGPYRSTTVAQGS